MQMSLASHRCCARLKILKQAWTFSVSPIITLSGLCIHRKAINKDKPLSSGWYPTTDCIPQALWCLEGTTMSNRGQRPRIHDTPPNICLEGSTPQDRLVSTTDWTDLTDLLVEEIDQKVSVGLGGVPPWAFRHRSLLKTRLGSSHMAQLPVLPSRTF